MIFLPYRIDSRKPGLPIFTVLVCLICAFVFWQQYTADERYWQGVNAFCSQPVGPTDLSILRGVAHVDAGVPCYELFEGIREEPDQEVAIADLAQQSLPLNLFATREDDVVYIRSRVSEMYARYDAEVPRHLTNDLAYDPKDLDLVKMLTSTFSHGSVAHLVGNLLFFYIFAASVELIIGSLTFALFIAATAVGTSLAYSYAMVGVENALPTIGLSGVVMAMVTALAVMMPQANIRCFFWFVVFFKVFRVPALVIALWFVGWDLYEMSAQGNDSYINYVAHISGAALGAVVGAFYLVFKKSLLVEAAVSY